MKKIFFAAIAVLGLSAVVVPVANASSTIFGDQAATRAQQTGGYAGGGN